VIGEAGDLLKRKISISLLLYTLSHRTVDRKVQKEITFFILDPHDRLVLCLSLLAYSYYQYLPAMRHTLSQYLGEGSSARAIEIGTVPYHIIGSQNFPRRTVGLLFHLHLLSQSIPTVSMSTRELFGDSSSDDDDEKDSAPTPAPGPVAALEQPANHPSDEANKSAPDSELQDSDEDDVEFDDQGAVVGVSSTTMAGQVQKKKPTTAATGSDAEGREGGSDMDVEGSDKAPEVNKMANWTIQEATRPNVDMHMTKLPNLVGMALECFEPDQYDPDQEEEDFGGAVHNLIRWRYKRNETGNLVRNDKDELVRESNTRLVEWEDGSLTLHVGNEAFEVQTLSSNTSSKSAFAGLNGYLYLSQTANEQETNNTVGTILESIGKISSRLTVKPSGLQSEAHKSLTVAVRQKTIKKARIAEFMTQEDPEKLKQERIKTKSELEKAQARKRPTGGYTRRPRMSREYLEEDDADFDTTNIRAMKRRAFEGDDDDQDDYGDDYAYDDDDDDEVFNRARPSKKAKTSSKNESSDDDVVMGAGDESSEEEEFNVARKPKAKTTHLAVLDDDDSD
jgi:RNA polymerase-associated protein LEO1